MSVPTHTFSRASAQTLLRARPHDMRPALPLIALTVSTVLLYAMQLATSRSRDGGLRRSPRSQQHAKIDAPPSLTLWQTEHTSGGCPDPSIERLVPVSPLPPVDCLAHGLQPRQRPAAIIDTFLFNGELDLLLLRLLELGGVVDQFILVESRSTHTGAGADGARQRALLAAVAASARGFCAAARLAGRRQRCRVRLAQRAHKRLGTLHCAAAAARGGEQRERRSRLRRVCLAQCA